MSILLHTCCAPCSVACVKELRSEGIEPVSYWYNPNIHPLKEYRMRRVTLEEYARSIGMRLIINNEYGLRKFIEGIYPDFNHRCGFCYTIRMEETARYAAEHGFEAFSSTLLISPYQNHELLKKVAEEQAARFGVKFLYRDFRPWFKEGQEEARSLGLYMQKYCGCIFSEEERYTKKKKSKTLESEMDNE